MAGKSFQLVVRSGPNPGKVFPIIKNEVIIGRDPNSDVLINDAEISRQHATVRLMPDGYVIEDLGSTNGTVINGKRLEGQHLLRPSEIINLGEHVSLIFEATPTLDPDATMIAGGIPIPSSPPAAQPVQAPRAYTPPPPAPPEYSEPETTRKKSLSPIIIIVIALVVVLCVCGGALAIIDYLKLWCDLPIFSALYPYC